MSLLKGKQIKDTSVDLTKLSGTGSVALTDSASFTLPTGIITASYSVVNKDYVDNSVGGDLTSLETRVSSDEVDLSSEIVTRSTADASLTTRLSTEEVTRSSADASLSTRVSIDEAGLSTELITRSNAVTSLEEAMQREFSVSTEVFAGNIMGGSLGAYTATVVSSVEDADADLVYSVTVNGKYEKVTNVTTNVITFAADYALDATDEVIVKYVAAHDS